MPKLYELSAVNREFWMNLSNDMENPDLDWQIVEDYLNHIEQDFDSKVENCAAMIREKESDNEAIDAEIKRLSARKKTNENNIKSLKEYVRMSMVVAQREKVKTPLFSISVQKSPARLVLDESKVPEQYWKTETVRSIDKDTVKKIVQSGTSIPGAAIVQDTHLRIR